MEVGGGIEPRAQHQQVARLAVLRAVERLTSGPVRTNQQVALCCRPIVLVMTMSAASRNELAVGQLGDRVV